MKIFDQLDFDSFSFRYPLDKKGSPNLPHDEKVDLAALKQTFDDAMILLRQIGRAHV